MTERKRTKSGTRRPGRLVYIVLGGLLYVYAAAFKKHRVVNELPDWLKPPFLIVGNHSSFYDFVYTVRALYPQRISFVVARKYFHYAGLGWLMKTARAIPKSLFQTDTGTIMAMFNILRQGGVVGIFPEGQISISGRTDENAETLAKFVKRAGVPVVRILTGGAYFCNPPWSKNARRGRVESTVSLVLTKEQVKELSLDAVMDRISQSIDIDNFAWQDATGSLYRGKDLALGLENVLYICPRCHQEYTMTAQGSMIRCRNCGSGALYGENGHLRWSGESHFGHVGDWLRWQLAREKASVADNDEFTVSEPVDLAMLKSEGKGTEVVGRGLFTAERGTYVYDGTLRGQEVKLSFATAGIRRMPFDSGRNFQIYKNDLLYEFRPENPVWCMKIANICEGLFELHDLRQPAPVLQAKTL